MLHARGNIEIRSRTNRVTVVRYPDKSCAIESVRGDHSHGAKDNVVSNILILSCAELNIAMLRSLKKSPGNSWTVLNPLDTVGGSKVLMTKSDGVSAPPSRPDRSACPAKDSDKLWPLPWTSKRIASKVCLLVHHI